MGALPPPSPSARTAAAGPAVITVAAPHALFQPLFDFLDRERLTKFCVEIDHFNFCHFQIPLKSDDHSSEIANFQKFTMESRQQITIPYETHQEHEKKQPLDDLQIVVLCAQNLTRESQLRCRSMSRDGGCATCRDRRC